MQLPLHSLWIGMVNILLATVQAISSLNNNRNWNKDEGYELASDEAWVNTASRNPPFPADWAVFTFLKSFLNTRRSIALGSA